MNLKNPGQKITLRQAKEKILRYCAYQDRCHSEVREKLADIGLQASEADELVTFLITEGFLNEERFARSYARGKFRLKRWGRIRIISNLEAKGVSKNCISAALKEIDDAEYITTLNLILSARARTIEDPSSYVRRNKVASHAIQKGFEPDLVWEAIRILLPGH